VIRFDISKLVDEPRRSGIQRVERELIRHWPDRGALLPCRFDASELRALPAPILDALCLDAPADGMAGERARLAPFLATPGPVVERGAGTLFCAELFDDPVRAAYHVAEAESAAWLVYDFLPWLRPEWFPAGPANRLMPYLHALRSVARRGFISAATRRDCAAMLRRPEPGPVLTLGADGLGLERQVFSPERRDIVLLGTIEARKNAAAALGAGEMLWREGLEFRLVLIGAVEPDALAEQALLRRLAGEARLVCLGAAPDAVVREALGRARALLFPSEGEGFGLPPMEALFCGIPVIVAAGLPALEGVPALGQIRLSPPDRDGVAAALRTVFDDGAAERLWAEAATLRLGTWREFAAGVAGLLA
jgi:glycosyltransferase involved in cell wall biosynthesis